LDSWLVGLVGNSVFIFLMTPSDFHGSWDRFKPLIGYSASSLREGIPMLTWAVPPISCYKTVVVGVVSQLVEVKTP